MSDEVFCMENQQSRGFIGNKVVRFKRTKMSDKKPTDDAPIEDAYDAYKGIFEDDDPLVLTNEEKQAILVRIAMERALKNQLGN